jgi:hypothetical protein
MPSVSRLPFEAHPFTIASFNSTLFDAPGEQTPTSEKCGEINLAEGSAPFWKELVFFINVREGFTARLKDAALKGDKVKVFVDGPYGPSPNLGSYDTSVLVAGQSLNFLHVDIAHATFRWIRGLVYATGIVRYNRVCRLDSRFCPSNLYFFSGVPTRGKSVAVVLFSSGQFGMLVRIIDPRHVAKLI